MRAVSGFRNDPLIGYSQTFNPGDGLRSRWVTVGAQVNQFARALASERSLGIILTGQSVIANWGSGVAYVATSPRSHMLNIFDGRCYPARDPVFGADGILASPSSALGDKLIAAGKYDRVTICNVAFGTTSSAQWADPAGYLANGLRCAYNLLRQLGYTNIVILHDQGEYDALTGVSQATMFANLNAYNQWRLKDSIDCNMYIGQATFSYDWNITNPDPALWFPNSIAVGIRAAQAAMWGADHCPVGPDVDLVRGPTLRTGAHPINQACCLAIADAWVAVIPASP